MFCRRCGTELNDEQLFCSNCGEAINSTDNKGNVKKNRLFKIIKSNKKKLIGVLILIILVRGAFSAFRNNVAQKLAQSYVQEFINSYPGLTLENYDLSDFTYYDSQYHLNIKINFQSNVIGKSYINEMVVIKEKGGISSVEVLGKSDNIKNIEFLADIAKKIKNFANS